MTYSQAIFARSGMPSCSNSRLTSLMNASCSPAKVKSAFFFLQVSRISFCRTHSFWIFFNSSSIAYFCCNTASLAACKARFRLSRKSCFSTASIFGSMSFSGISSSSSRSASRISVCSTATLISRRKFSNADTSRRSF